MPCIVLTTLYGYTSVLLATMGCIPQPKNWIWMVSLLNCRYACVDSYRALVLKPEWEKPYYRCAEAWIKLGDINNALTVNVSGRTACSERADLDKQYKEIQTLITAARYRESSLMLNCKISVLYCSGTCH